MDVSNRAEREAELQELRDGLVELRKHRDEMAALRAEIDQITSDLPQMHEAATQAQTLIREDGSFGNAVKQLCTIISKLAQHSTATECQQIIAHLHDCVKWIELGYLHDLSDHEHKPTGMEH